MLNFLGLCQKRLTEVLGHGVRLQREGVELVGIEGKLLLNRSKGLVVNEEEDLSQVLEIMSNFGNVIDLKSFIAGYTYSSISGTESIQLGLGVVLEHLLGHMSSGNQTLHSANGNVPDLLVLLLQEEDNARGLGVEGAGNVEDGVLNNALNGIIGDRTLGLQVVVSPAGLDQLQKGGGGRVLKFDSSGAHCGGF